LAFQNILSVYEFRKQAMAHTLHLGITGSRNGWTQQQENTFKNMLQDLSNNLTLYLHHGDCKGVDAQAVNKCREMIVNAVIINHPPLNPKCRAFVQSNETRAAKGYLARNRDIVEECEEIWGFPKTDKYQSGSGTWYTLKYACEKFPQTPRVWIIMPNGSIQDGLEYVFKS
jgi:hypothetical protein